MGNPALTEIEKILSLDDPLLSYKWIAKFLPFGLPPHKMESIDLPYNNIGVSEGVFQAGRFVYYPGTHTISSFSASFYEDRRGRTLKWLNDWKLRVKDFSTGDYGLPGEYKRSLIVTMLDSKNNDVITARLKGVFPTETAPTTLNYTDGTSRVVHSQTFSCDDQDLTFHQR
jgi:hypothetical protein